MTSSGELLENISTALPSWNSSRGIGRARSGTGSVVFLETSFTGCMTTGVAGTAGARASHHPARPQQPTSVNARSDLEEIFMKRTGLGNATGITPRPR